MARNVRRSLFCQSGKGEDGLRALEIAIAAEESHVRGMARKVETSNLEQFRAAKVRGGD
jgi:hypothetical protein